MTSLNVYLFIYFEKDRERERERERRECNWEEGQRQRGERKSQVGLNMGLDLRNHEIMTRAKIKSLRLTQLSHQAPLEVIFFNAYLFLRNRTLAGEAKREKGGQRI